MATKNIQLLLVENVDNLGIVGDVVNVRLGYARNYLLPRGLATSPSDDLLKDLAAKRAEAEKQVAALRKNREAMIAKLEGLEITMERPCNDQGILYGSVTQQDLAEALEQLGYNVKPREIRLPHTIKRVQSDSYDIRVKLDQDLETEIKLWVAADRHIEEDEREEMEFDNEGNLIEKPRKAPAAANGDDAAKPADAATSAPAPAAAEG
ncbi:MAG: 50S ribosomal protein L9 [Planctomycetota bacterium]